VSELSGVRDGLPSDRQCCPGDAPETFALARVGTLRSTFTSAFGCPRQGLAAPSVRGRIELEPWMVKAGGGGGQFLEGLEGFSHVWVIFMFDQNRHSTASFNESTSFLRPTVRPPWLSSTKGGRGSCGVFATRSPHRPNPIGLTVCRLDHVDHSGAAVYISGVDVVDGSAVLDIKPYHPIDQALAPQVPAGDGDEKGRSLASAAESVVPPSSSAEVRFADWLPAPAPRAAVRWSSDALERLEALLHHCDFYPDRRDRVPSSSMPAAASAAPTIGTETTAASAAASSASSKKAARPADVHRCREALEEVLGLDPRTPQARSKASTCRETTYRYWALDFDALSVAFRLAISGESDPATASSERPTFEVVSVERRGPPGSRASKAWLERLRRELEEAPPPSAAAEAEAGSGRQTEQAST